MTLLASESSAHGGRPIELYEFTADGQSYYLTKHPVPYTFGGDTYQPSVGLSRQNIVRAAAGDKPPELVIDVAEAEDLIQDNCYDTIPISFTVRIHRIQPGGSHTWWDGVIAGATMKGDRAELRCPSVLEDEFQNEVPNVHFTAQCNHFLYDRHCRLDPLDFAWGTTTVTVDGTTVTIAGAGGNPDNYFSRGTILAPSGERRTIIQHTGLTLILFHPFTTLAPLAAVTLYAGCDRQITTCVDKFGNKARFGGFPTVPVHNPWRRGIRGG
jgi:uncharacterized phage protein (TIGR02218 family)